MRSDWNIVPAFAKIANCEWVQRTGGVKHVAKGLSSRNVAVCSTTAKQLGSVEHALLASSIVA